MAQRLVEPISHAKVILEINSSYSALVFIALNSKHNDCSIRMSLDLSSIIPTPLPFKLESIVGGFSTIVELNSTKKMTRTINLMLLIMTKVMLYSYKFTNHDTILSTISSFFKAWRMW